MGDVTTRDHIVEAADQLFYRQGYEHTSFSDIADAVHISRGNFYYHFKSKDEILDAVIDLRLAHTQKMLEQWEVDAQEPADRIRSFIHILMANRAHLKRYGCPVGTLCTELAKLGHASQTEASALFTLFRTWLRRQFVLLGRQADADALAMHLLARSQGVATLANVFHDEKFIKQEVQQMCDWLSSCAENVARKAQGDGASARRFSKSRHQEPTNGQTFFSNENAMSTTIVGPDGKSRCRWCGAAPEFLDYHDSEWGFPVGDDRRLFEKLSLEGFQSGLSWRTILAKRENFRAAFHDFDFARVARFTERHVAHLLKDEGIIRHRGKIQAVINNARHALELVKREGSLAAFVWRYEPDSKQLAQPQTVSTSAEATALAKDLKKRGWKFVGPTTVYAFMQAMGLINDHVEDCVIRAKVERARNDFQRPRH